jgi:toxin ParE1/3/4
VKIVLTKRAFADLDDIRAFIAREDAERADAFVRRLHQKCGTLSRHPRRYPVLASIDAQDVRKLNYRGYLIFYVTNQKEVRILRIVHGARDWAVLF